MKRRHLALLVLSLAVTGLSLFGYKSLVLQFPLVPGAHTPLWDIEVRLTFDTHPHESVKVALMIPHDTTQYTIVNENFISQQFGLTTRTEKGNRKAIWSIRRITGPQSLYYRATVRSTPRSDLSQQTPVPTVEMPKLEGPPLEAALAVLNELQAQSADVETFVGALLERLNRPQSDDTVRLLLGERPSSQKILEVAEHLLALTGIAARAIHGVQLQERRRNVSLVHWLQVYQNGRWVDYHPGTGSPEIPDDYFAWWRGSFPQAEGTGTKNLHVNLAVAVHQEDAIHGAVGRGQVTTPHLLEFSLFSLPLETQAVYLILLTVPIGAFLTVALRNVVGIKTFGTFMPVLIALAFRETQLLWGIVLFSSIVMIGLTIRFYFEHLKLLLVPRLASILIVVILAMAVMSVVSHRLGLERGLSIALFPMVILTMTIERMCVVWEERGSGEALQQGIGSLLVASLAYSVMTISYAEHLMFVFPELLLVVLAGTLLLGRYSGYRLLELYRFKALAQRHDI